MSQNILELDAKTLDALRAALAPLYERVDALCDKEGMDRPPRF